MRSDRRPLRIVADAERGADRARRRPSAAPTERLAGEPSPATWPPRNARRQRPSARQWRTVSLAFGVLLRLAIADLAGCRRRGGDHISLGLVDTGRDTPALVRRPGRVISFVLPGVLLEAGGAT